MSEQSIPDTGPSTPGPAPEGPIVPLLVLEDLSKHYGGVKALSEVSFSVGRAEVLALAGDNGAGKSTLVKIISGIVRPDGGRILVRGAEAVLHTPGDANALGIQTVYQDLALCDNLDAVQNLYLGREIHHPWFGGRRLSRAAMEARAREVLADLGVKVRNYNMPVGGLSGGQRQSVAVARALLSEPEIVLLDEPTAALGVEQRHEVLTMISRLREHGRGVILVSHDLGDVMNIADRVVVLRLGRKVAEMTKSQLSRNALISAITGADSEVEAA